MNAAWIAATVGGVSLIALSSKASTPRIVWNASPSVPTGFYLIKQRQPRRGDLALVQLSPKHVELAHRRGYLATAVYLLKPIVAIPGDRTCRLGTVVLVRQRIVAVARVSDASGRLLPAWSGCVVLRQHAVFLLARSMHSFDGRYFGPTAGHRVVGLAKSIRTVLGVPFP